VKGKKGYWNAILKKNMKMLQLEEEERQQGIGRGSRAEW
jgi:hypothetical protein